jgi:hypothetical protein
MLLLEPFVSTAFTDSRALSGKCTSPLSITSGRSGFKTQPFAFSVPYLFLAFFGERIFMLWLFIKGSKVDEERLRRTLADSE